MTAPLILAFDTAAAHCAAALLCGDEILASRHQEMAKGQAERLLALVQELLTETGNSMTQLDAIGVGVGPGNFTGIRISVSAARGLALGLGIPSVGVNAFDALRLGADGPCFCTVDARRDMVFVQGFETAELQSPTLCHRDEVPAQAVQIGALGRAPTYPVAEAIARITATRFLHTTSAPAPLYLRPADAAPARDAPPQIVP
ncbi:tRNA (adenosine(37)-N6)-threonylcarbamoyltransferase complex dimerization subunit type 1 TsaB [Sulfitobacter sp. F26169L]|uniref:tRNA (adenosine(37)-N6)-threonylcarbamoyltransferase complex dimerization subunit type 1 TsaB n=1 Tax=Sulfitobacter sp. F26169L TaxID=2996015 RepID=UPI0022609EBA|nr:tRNA (adenosine(37)-N6)-threonylcarbamoyltransferase complex dimerization subunit type 1 TsaB [Sulfitobacter sp. F26169L]MCX7567196.1 tRNA (adenosine(37)-N6)-threonylcarbamoyltransferase complex dimerization subunit type 1 TsaB [Sulfitobacter sp. F26169L]